jgi:hypothetical protein
MMETKRLGAVDFLGDEWLPHMTHDTIPRYFAGVYICVCGHGLDIWRHDTRARSLYRLLSVDL